jgi:hypothetical protein
MLYNPPPSTCDHCRSSSGSWSLVDGPEQEVALEDGRKVTRRGRAYVCSYCGHTEPIATEGLHHAAWEPPKR